MNRKLVKLSILALFVLLLAACAPVAPAANTADAPQAYVNADALVDTDWVLEHLDDPTVRFLDIGGDPEVFAQGHLPGALFVNLGADLTNPDDSTRPDFERDALSALLADWASTALTRWWSTMATAICSRHAPFGPSNIISTRTYASTTAG
ncbi:MAG: rhodanese-like domain-containing protein [Caldilineaceae bacterium]